MPQKKSDDRPVTKKEILGWAMYDFANSSYTTVVITVIYSSFFIKYIVPPETSAKDSYWSLAIIIPTLITIFLAPFVGVLCDYSGRKKIYLGISTLLCSFSTMALMLVPPGAVWWGILFLTLSNVGFMISENFCASFLTDLSNTNNMAMISGVGWGIGYMGGLASLLLVMAVITVTPEQNLALYIQQNQWAMGVMGIFFLIASLPTFILVKERSSAAPGFEKRDLKKLFNSGWHKIKLSWSLVQQNQTLFAFLLAFTVYMAGVDAVIKFVGIYARIELEFSTADLTTMFLILQFSAMGGALGFGMLERWLGPKWTVVGTLFLWMAGVLGIFFLKPLSASLNIQPKQLFFFISLIAGMGIGATQSSSRAVVGLLTPPDQVSLMFGFWGMFGKLATILGMFFGFTSDLLDSRRMALLLVLLFFVVGAAMLIRIPIDQSIAEKRAHA
ncbi:MAG: MFS transporter [SAR324 cluster bacterium]|nr:MFS transporter [SAR324 cluster bacterium]